METQDKPFFSPESLLNHPAKQIELDIPEEEAQIILGADWTIIAKVASGCNMNCEYGDSTDPTNKSGKSCYMYADDSYKHEARFMEPGVARQLAKRMSEQARKFPKWRAKLVLHGGEPLLLGKERLSEFLEIFTNAVPDAIGPDGMLEKVIDIRLQTNATLLTKELMDEVVVPYGVKVTASLDGTREGNARRRMRNGTESYDKAVSGIRTLWRYPNNFPYILGVVDLDNDPVETDKALASFSMNRDYNLPHTTWDAPPPGKDPSGWDTPYGSWLIQVFDTAYNKDPKNPGHTGVRLIDSIIDRVKAKKNPALVETLPGLSPVREFTVGVSGELGGLDSLVAIGENKEAFRLNMTLNDSSIEDVIRHPNIMSRARNDPKEILKQLGPECRSCSLVTICGGGLIHDRHSQENGYQNPSVYCADIQALITHISRTLLLESQRTRYESYRTDKDTHPIMQPGASNLHSAQVGPVPIQEGDLSLWPIHVEYAFPSLTPFEELADLLAEVNIDVYSSFFPDQDMEKLVSQEWRVAKAHALRQRAQAIEEGWSYDVELVGHVSGKQRLSGMWVARIGKEVVGLSAVQILDSEKAMITNLHVRQAYRSRHVGQLLLSKVIDAAEPRDVLVQTHDVSAGDFYKKFGFEDTGHVETVKLFDVLPTEQRTFRLDRSKKRETLEKLQAAVNK